SGEQLDFLSGAAHILASTIQRYRYRETIAAYQADLEEMVEAKVKELHNAETRYRNIFNHSASAIYQISLSGQVIDCNPATAKMLGYTSPAELKTKVSDVGQQLYAEPERRRVLLERLQNGPVNDFIIKLRRRDGQYIWGQTSSRLVHGKDGSFLEGNMLDITKQREAELALAAEKERLLVTLRSIGDGVISTDAHGRISMLNKVAENLTGWRQDEAQGRPLTEVFHIINEKTRDLCDNPVEKVLQRGIIVGLANHTALVARDGSERIIADSGAPIRNRNSEIIGVVLVFRDITKASKMEEELRRKRQLESLGVLAGGIAHDFNNILTAILGNINLAEYIVKDDQKAMQLLEEADNASRRAAVLVQQLLTFSKGGAPVKAAASLVEIIKGTTDFIMRGSNIGCDYQLADGINLADVDSGQISQVIQNLVINAKQAMPEGGTITITCRDHHKTTKDTLPLKNGDYLQVTIEDEGSGIPLSRLDHIFDPYFTTKKSGNGLGLAIVHSIIHKHDGYIAVASKLGRGTKFSFYLPATDKSAIIPSYENHAITSYGKGTILLMDDEEMIRKTTGQMLHILGYKTVLASTGQEAVAQYQAAAQADKPFRAVVMDLTIAGGMGGKEAVRQILHCRPDAKVLVASGYGNDPILANPKAYGFAASLVKPFAMDDLARALNSILNTD
ncbi:MAG: PAS domain S-box protein, partial [Deltaproteobacteria bacterium]|nr:PAS domain S-box protein [Deltaproteobacteria bacterium]